MSHPGPVYTVPFAATVLTTNPVDLWCITAGSNTRVAVRSISVGQITESAASTSEFPLSMQVMRGSTGASAGTAIAAVNVRGHSGAPTASSSCLGPSTTLASSASATLVVSEAWAVDNGWNYRPCDDEQIVLDPSQRLAVRMSAPDDAMTIVGTLTLQEIGLAG